MEEAVAFWAIPTLGRAEADLERCIDPSVRPRAYESDAGIPPVESGQAFPEMTAAKKLNRSDFPSQNATSDPGKPA